MKNNKQISIEIDSPTYAKASKPILKNKIITSKESLKSSTFSERDQLSNKYQNTKKIGFILDSPDSKAENL